jgi:hypothetical protein
MGASKELFTSEQEAIAAGAIRPQHKQSLFHIRQDHMTVLALIEENEGELTGDLEDQLRLTEEGFKEKAISYGFVIKKQEAESDVIAVEIKRLTALKQRADKKAELFKRMLDEGMRQFGYDKVDYELLKISYRKTAPVELSEGFADNILKYADVSITINEEKVKAAQADGQEVTVTEDMLSYFDVEPSISKKRIGQALKEGMVIPGASMPEKKNLQIK